MPQHRQLVATVLFIGAGAVALAQSTASPSDAAKLTNPVASTRESLQAGRQVYERRCQQCHGANGKGGPAAGDTGAAPPDLTDAKWDHGSTDGEIFTVIKGGIPPEYAMEPWEDRLSDADIWNVVNYLRSIGPAR